MGDSVLVMKFGGTSVGSLERIRATAERIREARSRSPQIAVVVSAMSGQTDHLLGLGRSLNQSFASDSLRELDALAATGEQVSASLLALALQAAGVSAKSFGAHQLLIETDGRFQRARIKGIDSRPLLGTLKQGQVAVITGFQGTDERGNVVTLGRGGSDTSAVAIAIALEASACEIYTDVDGVYTADPRMVPQCRKIQSLSFEEMLELASTGAKVLMIRSVELAMKNNLPIAVRTSFSNAPGTMVMNTNGLMEGPVVTGLSHDLRQAKVSVSGMPASSESLSWVLGPLAEDDISVDFITQNVGSDGKMSIAFTIDQSLVDAALLSLDGKLKSFHPECVVSVTQPLAKVSAVGVGMRTHAGVANRFFAAVNREKIPISMALSTEIRVSCLIPADDCQRALQALHSEFFPPHGSN